MPARGTILTDLTGQRFGRWTVVGLYAKRYRRHSLWRCICDCGKTGLTLTSNLRRGSRSCGCLKTERAKACRNPLIRDVNGRRTPEYQTWTSMLARVRAANPKDRRALDYGLRGITVCKRWLKFENFRKDMGLRPPGTSLDRKNNDGPYCKQNCRWATDSQQISNRRDRGRVAMDRAEILSRVSA
jgi:hypothetical protein